MKITEVRVKLVSQGHDKLRAFCSITFDSAFVVRDLKVIDGTKGAFVAMPSRKATSRCVSCGHKNTLGSNYCGQCGTRVPADRARSGARAKMHADIAHPIHSACRAMIQDRVLEEYEAELEKSNSPDYQPVGFDDLDEDFEISPDSTALQGQEGRGGSAPNRLRGVEEDRADTPSSAASRDVGRRDSAPRDADQVDGEEAARPESKRRRLDPLDDDKRPGGGRVADDRAASAPQDSERGRGDSERRKRFFDEVSEAEPEDNFGAGLF